MSLSPKAIGPDCLSQHASHLCMNTTLVRWSGQKAPPSPGHPTQGFNTSDSPHARQFRTVSRTTLGKGESTGQECAAPFGKLDAYTFVRSSSVKWIRRKWRSAALVGGWVGERPAILADICNISGQRHRNRDQGIVHRWCTWRESKRA